MDLLVKANQTTRYRINVKVINTWCEFGYGMCEKSEKLIQPVCQKLPDELLGERQITFGQGSKLVVGLLKF
jgi:dTDP-D-glucose 4,6-dehydratase